MRFLDPPRMKIAIVATQAYAHGGMSRVIESWARVLGAGGHSVSVITPVLNYAIPLPAMTGVIAEPYEVPSTANRLRMFRRTALLGVAALQKSERQERVDLILSHDPYLAGCIGTAFPRTPLVLTIHSPFVDENRLNNWKYARNVRRRLFYPGTWAWAWRAERLGLQSASWVHTLSEYTWSLMRSRHPGLCRNLPWNRIPGTFDHHRFAPGEGRHAARKRLGLDPDTTILLTVRRLVPRNGVDRILSAAALLRNRPDIRFLIGGEGELLDPLRRRVEAESLTKTVVLHGLVPEDRLPLYYQAADAFLMPTRDLECFGLPTIEAMACGSIPLVMPDGGPEEVCRPFPQLVANANTTDAFAEKVVQFVSGKIAVSADDLVIHAKRNYSEEAVRPAMLDLVNRVRREAA